MKQTESKGAPVPIKEQLIQIEEYFKQNGLNEEPKQQKNQIAFAISLKSKTVSRDWTRVQANLADTLRSLMKNTDQNFRIIIAGHEKPELEELEHERVIWLPVDFPPPSFTNFGSFGRDKYRKRIEIGKYLRKEGYSGYFMPLDADDWIHHRFVEFIRSSPLLDAYIIDKGFQVNVMRKEVWYRNRFHSGCGSSAVFYFSNNDFPSTSKREDVEKTPFGMAVKDHKKVAEHLEEIDREYKMAEFPLVTWVLGHGDNNSVIKGSKDNGITSKNCEKLEDWFYDYFKII